MEEERRRREEIETTLKQQQLMWQQEREAERQRYEQMYTFMQAISSAVNIQPPPTMPWPPPPPRPMPFVPPPAGAITPVSMNRLHTTKCHIDSEM
jgi:hypothetical protein